MCNTSIFLVRFSFYFSWLSLHVPECCDYAVNETAKEIAAAIYPLSFINEIEDEKIEEFGDAEYRQLRGVKKLGQQTTIRRLRQYSECYYIRGFKWQMLLMHWKAYLRIIARNIGSIVDIIKPSYWDMKSAAKYMIADSLIRKHWEIPYK